MKTLDEVAGDEFEARMAVEGMSMMNTGGLSYQDRKMQAIEYAKAKYHHCRCLNALNHFYSHTAIETGGK